ncbi:hypothetical protein BJV77DRAFT_961277 [Russula vinacea]|nr:hypothetical protein BJV77DRAFT_961277 [Russula vinacea]
MWCSVECVVFLVSAHSFIGDPFSPILGLSCISLSYQDEVPPCCTQPDGAFFNTSRQFTSIRTSRIERPWPSDGPHYPLVMVAYLCDDDTNRSGTLLKYNRSYLALVSAHPPPPPFSVRIQEASPTLVNIWLNYQIWIPRSIIGFAFGGRELRSESCGIWNCHGKFQLHDELVLRPSEATTRSGTYRDDLVVLLTTPWNLHANEESFTIDANARNVLTYDHWFTGTTTQDYPKPRAVVLLHFVVIRRHMTTRGSSFSLLLSPAWVVSQSPSQPDTISLQKLIIATLCAALLQVLPTPLYHVTFLNLDVVSFDSWTAVMRHTTYSIQLTGNGRFVNADSDPFKFFVNAKTQETAPVATPPAFGSRLW